jgi:N-ethylmaleimide reductase
MVPYGEPRALEKGEVDIAVEAYRRAAEFAVTAGFDGIEVHAANGYLPDQFLEDGTNLRDDEYGGPPQNRIRFVLEILEAVTGVWGADRVGIHISPGNPFNSVHDSDPGKLFTALVKDIAPLGLAYLHVSEIDLADPGDHKGANYNAALNEITTGLRGLFPGPYITNGGYDGVSAAAVLSGGNADLVAFGRPYISNPDLPERLQKNAPLNDFDPDTLYGGGEKGYTDYPFLE